MHLLLLALTLKWPQVLVRQMPRRLQILPLGKSSSSHVGRLFLWFAPVSTLERNKSDYL